MSRSAGTRAAPRLPPSSFDGADDDQLNQPLVGVRDPPVTSRARALGAVSPVAAVKRWLPSACLHLVHCSSSREGTITVTDGIAMVHYGLKSSLVSREGHCRLGRFDDGAHCL